MLTTSQLSYVNISVGISILILLNVATITIFIPFYLMISCFNAAFNVSNGVCFILPYIDSEDDLNSQFYVSAEIIRFLSPIKILLFHSNMICIKNIFLDQSSINLHLFIMNILQDLNLSHKLLF